MQATARQAELFVNADVIGNEFLDFAPNSWTGVLPPASTPPDIVVRLNGVINETLQTVELTMV